MIPQPEEAAGLTSDIVFSGSTVFGFCLAGLVSLLIPAAAYLLMRRYRAARLYSVIVGMITYFLSVKLCDFTVMILFSRASAAMKTALAIAFVGFFEETGRWLAMKYPLTDIRRDSHAVCLGIGHAGMECMMRSIRSFQIARLCVRVRSRGTAPLLTGKTEAQTKQILQQLQDFADQNLFVSLLSCMNAVTNFCFHIALTMLIFKKMQEPRFLTRWLPLAFLLHFALNALYQDATLIGGAAFANIMSILGGAGTVLLVSGIINGRAIADAILYPADTDSADAPNEPDIPRKDLSL